MSDVRFPLSSFLIALVLLAGCGGAAEVSQDAVVTDASIAHPTRVATFGCDACAGLELLDRVRHLSMTPQGIIYVTGSSEPFVRRFVVRDGVRKPEPLPDAGFVSLGEGPGEVGYPFYTFATADEGFFVVDTVPPRITEFDRAGILTRTLSTPPYVPTNAAFHPESGVLYIAWMHPLGPAGVRIASWDIAGGSIAGVPIDGQLFPTDAGGRDRRTFSIASSPDGDIAIGFSWDYVVKVFDREGAPVADMGRDLNRRKKPAYKLAYEISEMERFTGSTGLPADVVDEYDHHFGRFAFDYDDSGTLWVLTTRGARGTTVFDLFAPDGSHVGETVVREELAERSWRAGNTWDVAGPYLAGVYLDEMENEFIGVWRIR